MSNIVEGWSKASTRFDSKLPLSGELEGLLRKSVEKHFGAGVAQISAKDIFVLCDQALLHHGSNGEREIFIYREGFYRGSSVALAFLGLALLVRMLHSPVAISVGCRFVDLHRSQIFLAACFSGFGAWLAYRRYLRFREYKIKTCLLRFLALWTTTLSSEAQ